MALVFAHYKKYSRAKTGLLKRAAPGIKLRISCVLQKVELKFFLNSFNLKDKSNS
jgi:hypothetical protein